MTSTQLKQWRKSKGWDQERLAAELKVSVHTVRSWEQGKNPVPHLAEKALLSETELKVPVGQIGELNEESAFLKTSFDETLSMALSEGLRVLKAKRIPTKRSAVKGS